MSSLRQAQAKDQGSGIVNDVRTYWKTTTERFFIPTLSLEGAKIN